MQRWTNSRSLTVLASICSLAICSMVSAQTGQHGHTGSRIQFNGSRAYQYAQDIVNCGPRWIGSQGHVCAENFLKKQFAKDNLEDDTFAANTPAGMMTMHNFIVKFPGEKPGVIVLASHYETNYPLRTIHYVGANDGAATSGLLIELANDLRGRTLPGDSVWLVFFDGEEAVQQWSSTDSLYGSRHLAARWDRDGTLKRIKAFLLVDMIGDKDLDIARDQNSTPWLLDLVDQAAKQQDDSSYFFATTNAIEDDHLPFVQRGVPCADLIDYDYGPHTSLLPDGYHHTAQDTMDKISAHSLTVVGQTVLETIHLLDRR